MATPEQISEQDLKRRAFLLEAKKKHMMTRQAFTGRVKNYFREGLEKTSKQSAVLQAAPGVKKKDKERLALEAGLFIHELKGIGISNEEVAKTFCKPVISNRRKNIGESCPRSKPTAANQASVFPASNSFSVESRLDSLESKMNDALNLLTEILDHIKDADGNMKMAASKDHTFRRRNR